MNVNVSGWDNSVCKSYNVSGVPGYFLIGKDGKIISNNPSRPSTGDAIKKELYAALEKK